MGCSGITLPAEGVNRQNFDSTINIYPGLSLKAWWIDCINAYKNYLG